MNVNIENIDINYIKKGEGKNILVLHGWGANIDTVSPIIRLLKDYFTVYAMDLPGFGASNIPTRIFGTEGYANIVIEFIKIMSIEKPVLIGHSFGGKLSIFIGANYPELVDKIVLINSSGLMPKRGLDYYIKVYSYKALKKFYEIFLAKLDDNNRMKGFYNKFGSSDYKDAEGIMKKILVKVVNEDLKPMLKSIQSPTLLIWGDKDATTPLYMGKAMEKEIPDSGLVILEGAGHYSYIDSFNKFAISLRPYLKKLRDYTGETANLTIMDNHKIVYIAQEESDRLVKMFTRTGATAPLHCTAAGKILLAYKPKEMQKQIIDRIELDEFTKYTITNKELLYNEIEKIVENGYGFDNEERELGVSCIGAPVFDLSGDAIACLTISGPSARFNKENTDKWKDMILKISKEASDHLKIIN